MRLYAPEYYKDFQCIKDKCTHSCCIGWEIDVDEVTRARYLECNGAYARAVCDSIDEDSECGAIHFRMREDGRCPHLTEDGLCRIIIELGEDYLADICREHPRFYNITPHGAEVGLGAACEEACRIILSSDSYAKIVEIGETDGESTDSKFDTAGERENIYAILSARSVDYESRLASLYEKYGICPTVLSDGEWRGVIDSLEYLDEEHRSLFLSYSSTASMPEGCEELAERALAYFIYRHTASALDRRDLVRSLGFALFCERLFVSLLSFKGRADLNVAIEAARIISEEIEYSEDNTEDIMMTLDFYIA